MATSERAPTCEDRVAAHLKSRLRDLQHLYGPDHKEGGCACEEGSRYDYGLCFDYVPKGTFKGQRSGYFRYQLSTGGPGDEFRFFVRNGAPGRDEVMELSRVEYWFLDWWDGARRSLRGADYDTLSEVFEDFREVGAVDKALSDVEA